MNPSTLAAHHKIIASCKKVFEKKNKDYGTAWRILRLPSITDQIMIKAQRIRSIQEKNIQKVGDDMGVEFIGIINYSLIALIQIELQDHSTLHLTYAELEPLYDALVAKIETLLQAKNHDYGEAWRGMRLSSITDIILMKLLRIQQIEDNQGKTLVSEGIATNYQDIVNYAVFSLIKLGYPNEVPVKD